MHHKKNFDEKVMAPNLKDSGSDNSGFDAEREKKIMREVMRSYECSRNIQCCRR